MKIEKIIRVTIGGISREAQMVAELSDDATAEQVDSALSGMELSEKAYPIYVQEHKTKNNRDVQA